MAHKQSAKKHLRQDAKRRMLNKSQLTAMRTKVKRFLRTVVLEDVESAEKQLPEVTRALYRTAEKNIIHKNKAARTVSRLTKKLNNLRARKQAV